MKQSYPFRWPCNSPCGAVMAAKYLVSLMGGPTATAECHGPTSVAGGSSFSVSYSLIIIADLMKQNWSIQGLVWRRA